MILKLSLLEENMYVCKAVLSVPLINIELYFDNPVWIFRLNAVSVLPVG